MRVLVAGASGALGVPLTRLLVARGHSVVGLIGNPASCRWRASGSRNGSNPCSEMGVRNTER